MKKLFKNIGIGLLVLLCFSTPAILVAVTHHGPVGGVHWGVALDHKASCPKDREIIYESIDVDISWKRGTVGLNHSWQCTKLNDGHDTYRVYEFLGQYDDRKEPGRDN